MKKTLFVLVLSFLAIATAIYLDFTSQSRNDDKKIRTYDTGYTEGFSVGYEAGYDEGYTDAYDEGYADGHADAYDEGYSCGEADGYYSGATYACLFYGDVDRAFKSAQNGGSWYTFVDAYDEYISDIYDDNETRIEIIWTLIGAATGDKLSDAETELLITAFGQKIFVDNGIPLTSIN